MVGFNPDIKIKNEKDLPQFNPVPEGVDPEDFHIGASIMAKKMLGKDEQSSIPNITQEIYKQTAENWAEVKAEVDRIKTKHFTTKEELMSYIKGTHPSEEVRTKDILDIYK